MNMLITTCVLLFLSASVGAQSHLLIKKGSEYHFQNEIFHFGELDKVYVNYKPSLEVYNLGFRKRDLSKNVALAGLYLFGGGVLLSYLGADALIANGGGSTALVVGLLSIGSSIILEFVAIGMSVNAGGLLKEARYTFNEVMIQRHGYKSEATLSFGMMKNGIGLVYSF
ncbi:MAG: hypothetical protein AAGA77_08645 [Bacteroidota bacterium]